MDTTTRADMRRHRHRRLLDRQIALTRVFAPLTGHTITVRQASFGAWQAQPAN